MASQGKRGRDGCIRRINRRPRWLLTIALSAISADRRRRVVRRDVAGLGRARGADVIEVREGT
eukprot:3488416-Alexandrium_andersonii.AAC.1